MLTKSPSFLSVHNFVGHFFRTTLSRSRCAGAVVLAIAVGAVGACEKADSATVLDDASPVGNANSACVDAAVASLPPPAASDIFALLVAESAASFDAGAPSYSSNLTVYPGLNSAGYEDSVGRKSRTDLAPAESAELAALLAPAPTMAALVSLSACGGEVADYSEDLTVELSNHVRVRRAVAGCAAPPFDALKAWFAKLRARLQASSPPVEPSPQDAGMGEVL